MGEPEWDNRIAKCCKLANFTICVHFHATVAGDLYSHSLEFRVCPECVYTSASCLPVGACNFWHFGRKINYRQPGSCDSGKRVCEDMKLEHSLRWSLCKVVRPSTKMFN